MPGQAQDVTTEATSLVSGSIAFAIPGTLLRARGLLRVSFLTTGLTADDNATMGFGLGLFATDAVAAGAGSMPDPLGEPEFPWIWYGQVLMYSPNADHAAPGIEQEIQIDSKAMRKFKPGQSLVIVGQYADLGGLPGLRVDVARTRVLIGT